MVKGKWIYFKVEGGSLIEVLVAMGIISICMLFLVLIQNSISRSTPLHKKIRANSLVQEILYNQRGIELNNNKDLFAKISETDHPEFRDCKIIKVVVYDMENKILSEAIVVKSIEE